MPNTVATLEPVDRYGASVTFFKSIGDSAAPTLGSEPAQLPAVLCDQIVRTFFLRLRHAPIRSYVSPSVRPRSAWRSVCAPAPGETAQIPKGMRLEIHAVQEGRGCLPRSRSTR